jgi:hypothetical protein
MAKKIGIEVSLGISEAVKLADVDAIAAYPITPQTHIVEHLSELVADGELNAEFIPVESEHSAMSVCAGTAAAGARTYTATSSQGLALMNEILFIIPALRLPVVMTIANRALSGPISIWNDHSDIMSVRDTGWIEESAALVAEVSTPSHGVGYEIGYALQRGKKVLCLHRAESPVSKMITGNREPNLTVQSYVDEDEAVRHLLDWIENA